MSLPSGGREMVVRGTHLDTAQTASLVVTVASQISKRSIGSEGPKNIEFVEVSYQLKQLFESSHPNFFIKWRFLFPIYCDKFKRKHAIRQ